MTSWQVVVAVVAAYLVINLIVGLLPSSRSTDTVAGYVAGGREFLRTLVT